MTKQLSSDSPGVVTQLETNEEEARGINAEPAALCNNGILVVVFNLLVDQALGNGGMKGTTEHR